ncbi:hypothetical protein ACWIDW_05000 [Microbacterium sp. NPDC055312]
MGNTQRKGVSNPSHPTDAETGAPAWENQRFITNPASGATDYFQTLPVAKLTVVQYETVELKKVIVASGTIYTVDSPDPSQGSVYSGTTDLST